MRIHRGAIHRVAARRVAPIGPIHDTVVQIEVQIDRLGRRVIGNFDVCSIGRRLACGNFDAGADNVALAGVVGTTTVSLGTRYQQKRKTLTTYTFDAERSGGQAANRPGVCVG